MYVIFHENYDFTFHEYMVHTLCDDLQKLQILEQFVSHC
jgi:hypothetical protein